MASRGLSGIQRSSCECHLAPALTGELTCHHVQPFGFLVPSGQFHGAMVNQ
jgi:hypothetical protein